MRNLRNLTLLLLVWECGACAGIRARRWGGPAAGFDGPRCGAVPACVGKGTLVETFCMLSSYEDRSNHRLTAGH